MNSVTSLTKTKIDRAIEACVDNADRLLEEIYDLEFRKPSATRYYLIIIAQEEAAKAFLLYLVQKEIVPLSSAVLRAINDHACKHLVGMIMDYMIMHWETTEELMAIIKRDVDLGDDFPDDVASAVEILRYEKIGRWTANNWVWAEDPAYDASARRLAEGKKDRKKQDALYVRIGSDGQVASTPATVDEEQVVPELERARRYVSFVCSLVSNENKWFSEWRYSKMMATLTLLFAPPKSLEDGTS